MNIFEVLNIEGFSFMANLYPNVSVAFDMNAKLSASFKNAKSRLKNDFYANLSDFFHKTHFGWVFYSFLEWVFCGFYGPGFLGLVFCTNPDSKSRASNRSLKVPNLIGGSFKGLFC